MKLVVDIPDEESFPLSVCGKGVFIVQNATSYAPKGAIVILCCSARDLPYDNKSRGIIIMNNGDSFVIPGTEFWGGHKQILCREIRNPVLTVSTES